MIQYEDYITGSVTRYWHITHKRNLEDIKQHGLNANEEGYIYLLADLFEADFLFGYSCYVPDLTALFELSLRNYVLIEINPEGITEIIDSDNSPSRTNWAQRRVYQSNIEPIYLTDFQLRKVDMNTIDSYEFCKKLSWAFFSKRKMDKVQILFEQSQGNLPIEMDADLECIMYDTEEDFSTRISGALNTLNEIYPMGFPEIHLN